MIQELWHIEETIDQHGLATVLETIGDICHGKADHLRSNWQDEETAKLWSRAGAKVSGMATNQHVLNVSS